MFNSMRRWRGFSRGRQALVHDSQAFVQILDDFDQKRYDALERHIATGFDINTLFEVPQANLTPDEGKKKTLEKYISCNDVKVTLVHCAVIRNDIDALRALLVHRPNLNLICKRRPSVSEKLEWPYCLEPICLPVHLAVLLEHNELLASLLDADGVDVNLCDFRGHTPLDLSFYCGNLDVIKLIRSKGGRYAATDELTSDMTVVDYLKSPLSSVHGMSLMLQYGYELGDDILPAFIEELDLDDPESELLFAELLSRGYDVLTRVGVNRSTLLHLAADVQCVWLATLLIEKGVDVLAMDIRNRNCLHRLMLCK